MTLAPDVIAQVRQRASFACEYYGVTETDCGGQLTVDHFRPRTRGGTVALSNLPYCCYRCNLYKADYWPNMPGDPHLWNPRQEPMQNHLLALPDGNLRPITATGELTLARLRLNRPALVANRLRRLFQKEQDKLLRQYQDLVALLKQLYERLGKELEENRALLLEKRAWTRHLISGNGKWDGDGLASG